VSATAAPTRSRAHDLRLALDQVGYAQLSFWLNPVGAAFTVGFSLLFLVLLGATAGHSRIGFLGNIRVIQYYVPGFMAYGVMSACFTMLAVSLVVRREAGLLKRARLSPLPTWMMLTGLFGNSLLISVVQVVLVLAVGAVAFGVSMPANPAALVVALAVGATCFSALGVAASTLIPNQDAAGPIASTVFFVLLFLSGLWFPIRAGSGLATVSGFFPVRHMIVATFSAFDARPGVTGWAWSDVLVMAIWAVVGVFVSVRRFRWALWRG
jgi:ABC-2 type transport system permease protein